MKKGSLARMRPACLLGNRDCQKLTRYPHITRLGPGLDSDKVELWPSLAESREALHSAISGVRDKRGGYGAREAQKSSNRSERMQQRKAMMALAPRTDQRIPDCFRRSPITVRQPASTTPEPTKNFFSRYSA